LMKQSNWLQMVLTNFNDGCDLQPNPSGNG